MDTKKNGNFFILHFQPLERFPPVINLLNYFGTATKNSIYVVSTSDKKGSPLKKIVATSKNIKLKRTPGIVPSSVLRIFNYCIFYITSLFLLFRVKPLSVLYFETLSSWPALVYKKLRGKKVKLFLHCHEYTSPQNYNDMWLVKTMHKIETKMYSNAYCWISHTNEVRLMQFKKDHGLENVNPNIFRVMPNYPPQSWSLYQTDFGSKKKTRLVFVGSLGYDNMYLQETIDWVLFNKEFLTLDIYAYNIDQKAKDLLESIEDDSVKYYGGISYESLPTTLKNYDVGLVIYKPFSYNTVIAVSNKVFEYLACGLDVWFSEDMSYTLPYIRDKSFPKIIALDFKKIGDFNFKKELNRDGLKKANNNFFCESVYDTICQSMFSHSFF